MVRPVIAALGGLVLLAGLCVPQTTAAAAPGSSTSPTVTTSPPSPTTVRIKSHHYAARGLDSCNAPTHSQMAAFWHNTRWWWWAIYIGGENRACPNNNLTPRWIHREIRRGWGLQPIWVGPQAPCASQSGLASMAHHRARAYRQGVRVAAHAYKKVKRLEIHTHTPVVYDMEAFDTTKRWCVRAVKAFVRGWSHQLGNRTNALPGYYGSTCASDVSAMWNISPRPYYIWGANYGTGPNTFKMSCVSKNIWPHRLKQYTGGSLVTENGVTLSVDRDCANGPMYSPRRHNLNICT
ncbi:MAG: DUF1906 domain-containing protein [Nocardioides sp.]|nr:DUF1906 domain-containing protein [Nocardioides sp.]